MHEPQVRKRDGTLVPFDRERIVKAVTKAGNATGEFNATTAHGLTAQALRVIKTRRNTDAIADIERIQDIVEQTLIDSGYTETARAYIVYRTQHDKLRKDKKTLVNVGASMNEYLEREDWRVSANANQGYSLGGLILNTSGKVTANYWLNHVYSPEIGEAHREGDFHIHDLDMLAGYCFTGDTKVALLDGTHRTLRDLAENCGGQSFWVYSRDDGGNIVPGLAHSPRLTRRQAEVVSVDISGGSSIRCTADHKFMMRDGTYRQAKDLRQGDSLMPLYLNKSGNYLRVQDAKLGIKSYVHRHMAEAHYRIDLEGKVVHHRNGNKYDNRPENLTIMDDPSHRAMELARTRQTDLWKQNNTDRLRQYNQSREKRREVSAFSSTRQRDTDGRFFNHTVRSMPRAVSSEDVYCLTVDDYENFALSSGVFVHNCAGWSLRTLLNEGLNGVPGKVEAKPPKHMSSAIGQIVNFLGTLQNEWAGAQAFSSFDTYMAPYVRVDNLNYKQVRQYIQELIYNLNVPSRWGTQTPFTNLTFDLVCPEDIADNVPLIGGKEVGFCYGDLQEEMNLINRAYIEVMTEGDAKGRVFTFPIPTYNITPDFDWNTPIADALFEMTAKYGIPYFQNFLNSDLKPNMVRSMCPLHPDTEVVVRSSKRKLVTVQTIGDLAKNETKGSSYEVLYEGEWIPASTNIQSSTRCRTFVIKNGTKVTMDDRHEQICKRKRGADTETLPAKKLKAGYYVPFNGTACSGDLENHDAGYAVGAYLGDGSYDNGGLVYSLSRDKEHVVLAMCGFFEHLGYTVVVERGDRELVSVKVSRHNAASRTWMEQFVSGENALEKRLTSRCWALGPQFLQGVLDGWYDTDGGNRGRIYTASTGLIEDFSVLCGLLGKAYKVDREGDTREGRLGTNPVYTLKTHKRGAYKGEFFYEDGMWWFPISAIEQNDYVGSVYCLEVDHEDHLFQLANGMVTHNCRLQLDLGELLKRGNGLFGSAEQTGSLGVVTINCARLGYLFPGAGSDLLAALDRLLGLARDSLEVKRKIIQKYMDNGLFPYTKRYLGTLRNHFSTIGVNGINEMIENFTQGGSNLTEPYGINTCKTFLDHIRHRLTQFQEETGHMYNLEATPAEGTTYRFAREDQKRYSDIKQAGTPERPYYTNSSQLPVGYTDDPFHALKLQEPLQGKYTGGTVMHLYLGERMSSAQACKALVRRSLEGFRIPYITITPTFSICPVHGYIAGDHEYCPTCDAELLAKKAKSS